MSVMGRGTTTVELQLQSREEMQLAIEQMRALTEGKPDVNVRLTVHEKDLTVKGSTDLSGMAMAFAQLLIGVAIILSLPFKRMVATIAIVATVWLAKKIRTRLKKRSRRAQKARALLTKSGFFKELMVQTGKLFSKLRKRKKEEQANDKSKN